MSALEPPDLHYVNAAQGWLGLGDVAEAESELHRVIPEFAQHPEVLEVWWHIHVQRREWETALSVAQTLIICAPKRVDGWINQSFCLHELKRTEDARERLLAVADQFPRTLVVPYNIACYACQLGNLAEARAWLTKAVKIGGHEQVKSMALADTDLQSLWNEIKGDAFA